MLIYVCIWSLVVSTYFYYYFEWACWLPPSDWTWGVCFCIHQCSHTITSNAYGIYWFNRTEWRNDWNIFFWCSRNIEQTPGKIKHWFSVAVCGCEYKCECQLLSLKLAAIWVRAHYVTDQYLRWNVYEPVS